MKLYGGIATTALGAAAMVLLAISASRVRQLQDDPGFNHYRAGITSNKGACDEARAGVIVTVPGASTPQDVASLCDDANTFTVLSYVAAPTGGLLLAGGLVMIITSDTVWSKLSSDGKKDPAPPSAWKLVPHLGPESGGATLTYRF